MKTKIIVTACVALCLTIVNAQQPKTNPQKAKTMTFYWYQCKNCGTTIKKDSQPNDNNCPKKPFHKWTKLAEVGDVNYQCKNCGTTIQAKSSPSTSNCPNASFHKWTKL